MIPPSPPRTSDPVDEEGHGAAGPRPDVQPRVVAIGGGHGLSRSLTAMRICGWRPTAVVSVADDGGSSGRLRQELDVSPPGDLRRALSTLCPDPVRRDLLEYRFDAGDLAGHALGNLVLVAGAALRDGDLTAGLEMLADLFGARGRVVPVCDRGLDLEATLADGTVVQGQKRVATTAGIRRVRLHPPDIAANPVAVAAIAGADLVVIGPGSLFTSLVPPLLACGIGDALRTTDATTVVVANIRQQLGETSGMDLQDHVEALFRHLPDDLVIDVLVVNDGEVDPGVPGDRQALAPAVSHARIARVVTANVTDEDGGHDPVRLAAVLAAL